MRSTRLRFNMGFWGFIFPLGVFTNGSISLANAIPSGFLAYLSLVQLAALVSRSLA
jgi:tellurite resistance protein TehA-like permease